MGLTEARLLKAVIVECYLDSELVVRQMKGEYKVKNKNIRPLYQQAVGLIKSFQQVTFNHVPREKNEEADKLVNEAVDREV